MTQDEPASEPTSVDQERAPLLTRRTSAAGSASQDGTWRYDIVVIIAVMLFLLEVGLYMNLPARGKVMEDIVCRSMFPFHADDGTAAALTDSPACRSPEVQGKIAMLQGWAYTIETIPGLLTAIPYGVATDRFGRKPMLILAFVGLVLSLVWAMVILAFPAVFPIELYVLYPLFHFIGGGLFDPILYTIGADVVPQAKMATVYLQIGTVAFAAELVGAQVGGILTDMDPWLSMLVGFGMVVLACLGVFAMPETMHMKEKTTGIMDDDEPPSAEPDDVLSQANEGMSKSIFREGVALMVSRMSDAVTFLYGNTHLMLLLFSLVFSVVGKFVQTLLLQYAANRYGLTWGQASQVVSIRSIFVAVWQLIILPAASWYLITKRGFPGVVADLWMARTAVFGLSIGALCVAFSASPITMILSLVIFSFGNSFTFIVRSVLNSLVDAKLRGTLNATIGFCDRLGMIVAIPIMSAAFKLGMKLGGNWMGLPFDFAAGMFSISAVIVWLFRLRPEERN